MINLALRPRAPVSRMAVAGLAAFSKRTAAAVAAAVAALALLATPALARTADVGLYYKVYIGGFHVVDLRLDIGLDSDAGVSPAVIRHAIPSNGTGAGARTYDPRSYDVRADIKSSGMIGQMFPWNMKAYSKGALAGDAVHPVAAGQENTWNGKRRFIDLSFDGGVARVERIEPTPGADDRDSVSEELRTGAVDLTSAILGIITNMEADGRCAAQIPVFDGRRRFDLMVEPDGVDRLRPNRYSPFEGATTNCIVWLDRKAGFKKRDSSGWNDSDRRARVWMGRAFGDAPPVPVRLTFPTPFGDLIAHLNRATLVDGGDKKILSQAN